VTSGKYEQLVAATTRDLKLGGSKGVYHQREFIGKRTGRKIKVDVSFELELANFTVLCIVECKWYNHRVDVSEVEEFRTKLDDIGAHKGLMFTTVGYQDGAVKVAKAYGIALARLSDSPLPGDILAITKAVSARKPPTTKVAGELLSGAVHMSLLGTDYWQWFPCGTALLHDLYLVDALEPVLKLGKHDFNVNLYFTARTPISWGCDTLLI
jgi:restriction system protein